MSLQALRRIMHCGDLFDTELGLSLDHWMVVNRAHCRAAQAIRSALVRFEELSALVKGIETRVSEKVLRFHECLKPSRF